MATLFAARHGNTFDDGDTPTRIGRRTDLPLSQSGRAQADQLGAYFSGHGITFAHIYAAPLRRTMETAQAIARHARGRCSIAPEPALLEIDYGPDENQPEASVIARIGKDALDQWNAASIPPPGWDVDPEGLIAAWRDLFARIRETEPDCVALAVTSNGVARFALDAADAVRPEFPKKLRTGAFGRIELNGNNAVVAEWDVRP